MNRAARRQCYRDRSPATLTACPAPAVDPAAVRYTLDCPHSTTTALMIPPAGKPAAVGVLWALVRKRQLVGAFCGCTRALMRRYPAEPPEGAVLWILTDGEAA